MILSGIVGRSRVMSMVPSEFASVWVAMVFLLVVLIIIGMTMDPYGAVILVSASFAPVAYKNGIDPVHFWLVVLVAFELGYLTPPVALNQQFTRMVIGEDEYEAVAATDHRYDSFWRNYEFILLPIAVMSIVLLIVAFGPLLL
ncbi:MAG: TRAP transporter large permease subunit [bacterium]